MKAWDIIGWAYDAALHCDDCARKRFGDALDDDANPPWDSEGNLVHPIFASDEGSPEGDFCGDCLDPINEPYDTTTLKAVLWSWAMVSGENECCGDASEGFGWAGLFLNVPSAELREAGLHATYAIDGAHSFILTLDTYGHKDVEEFDNEEEAREAWIAVCRDLEPEPEAEEEEA